MGKVRLPAPGYALGERCSMGRTKPVWDTHRIVNIARERRGQWIEIDGGSLRLRVYKKATAHLEVHPEMAWRPLGARE